MSHVHDELRWVGAEGDAVDGAVSGGSLTFSCGPSTDWFRDPRTGDTIGNAPVAVVAEGTPLTVACVARPGLESTFDAAGMFVHYDDAHWIKLALERSPAGDATIVTVKTAGVSDDCNHIVLAEPTFRLRVTMDASTIALHVADPAVASGEWRLVRYGAHPSSLPPAVGLLVQSPTGSGTTGHFDEIVVERSAVEELRDGS